MPGYRKPFRIEVLTPEGSICEGEVVSVVFPASDGLVGVLGGRSPLVATIGAGPLVVESQGGGEQLYFVAGGFAQVRDNEMTILAEECIPQEKLDRESAWDEIDHAKSLPCDTDAARAHRESALAAARMKFKMSQK